MLTTANLFELSSQQQSQSYSDNVTATLAAVVRHIRFGVRDN